MKNFIAFWASVLMLSGLGIAILVLGTQPEPTAPEPADTNNWQRESLSPKDVERCKWAQIDHELYAEALKRWDLDCRALGFAPKQWSR